MDIVVVIAFRRGQDALGFLVAVVGFDAQAGVDLGLEDAGLLLPGVVLIALHRFRLSPT